MTADELRERVNGREWWHRIDLGHGVITPGMDDSATKLAGIHMPADLTGRSVLDVGAWDGYFSFEAERRGASRVVASDHYMWHGGGMGDGRGFRLAHEALASRVERCDITVEDLSPETVGTFDLVLFLGVLYHAQDPMRYLRIMRSVCRGQLILETHVDALDYGRPAMVFYPGDTLNGDTSNFWGPNPAAVVAMLREVGFARVETLPAWRADRLVAHAFVE